jgi:hypothetical protein
MMSRSMIDTKQKHGSKSFDVLATCGVGEVFTS